jgi:hypothetical protein
VAVAVTVQVEAELGAVNTPELEIEPQDDVQVTAWLAVNVRVLSACRFTVFGDTVSCDVVETEVLAVRLVPSVAVATTVQDPAVIGAV